MTPRREQELRERIAGMLCIGCKRGDPLDRRRRHTHSYTQEAFGGTWESTSIFPCEAKIERVDAWLAFVGQVVKEEHEAKR